MPIIHRAVPYLTVQPLEEHVRFYTEILGYEIVEELRAEGERFWVSLRNGESRIMLSNRLVHDRDRLTWLVVDDADLAFEELVAKGYRPLSEPADQEHANREFLVADPSGNVYVIAARL